ncbi:MAG: ribosomal protein S6e [Cenarchaeum symbiont of Oopsacas minuta]|nr:ribosomal protein S6e [Cenarchaeum symbiont of Oopsacas minuta]
MASFKITISDTKGRSTTKELKDDEAIPLLSSGIGKELDASIVGFGGKIKITGGSDKSGVPMRQDVHGGTRKYVLLSPGVGLRKTETGMRKRKLVRGEQITEEIYQINCRLDGIIPEKEDKLETPKNEDQKDKPAKKLKQEKE